MDDNNRAAAFRPGIRMLRGSVTDLALHRGWCPNSPLSLNGCRGNEGSVTEWISGTFITRDHLVVVDSDRQTHELNLTLRPFDSIDDHAAAWERIAPLIRVSGEEEESWDAEQNEALRRLLSSARTAAREFDHQPPTATVYFSESDPEVGSPARWGLDCDILQSIFGALAADIRSGDSRSLEIAIRLNPPLTSNYYAPPAEAVTLGVLRYHQRDGGTSRGWVEGIEWTIETSKEPNHKAKLRTA